MKVQIEIPDNLPDLIRLVCYLRAWSCQELGKKIGVNQTYMSLYLHGKRDDASGEVYRRVREMMPDGVEWGGE